MINVYALVYLSVRIVRLRVTIGIHGRLFRFRLSIYRLCVSRGRSILFASPRLDERIISFGPPRFPTNARCLFASFAASTLHPPFFSCARRTVKTGSLESQARTSPPTMVARSCVFRRVQCTVKRIAWKHVPVLIRPMPLYTSPSITINPYYYRFGC